MKRYSSCLSSTDIENTDRCTRCRYLVIRTANITQLHTVCTCADDAGNASYTITYHVVGTFG